jgi:hypothetical protein
MANLNIDSVSPKRAYELANEMVKMRNIPFFFHGRPGIGKSDIVEQLAKANNMNLEILMLTQIDSQDLRGIQYPDAASKRMVYYPGVLVVTSYLIIAMSVLPVTVLRMVQLLTRWVRLWLLACFTLLYKRSLGPGSSGLWPMVSTIVLLL